MLLILKNRENKIRKKALTLILILGQTLKAKVVLLNLQANPKNLVKKSLFSRKMLKDKL